MGFTPGAGLDLNQLNTYFRVAVEPIFRKSAFMAALKTAAAIKYGAKAAGKTYEWHPRVRRRKIYPLSAYNAQHVFPSVPLKMKVTLPLVAYGLGEKTTKFDRVAQKNTEWQLDNMQAEVMDGMAEDFVQDFGTKLFLDGGAAASEDLHGLETLFAVNGLVSGSKLGDPNDTYATKPTNLGTLGGDWTGTFPEGHGDTEYCAWSPHVWDAGNPLWASSATKNWKNLWQEILNNAIAYMGRLQKSTYGLFLTTTEWLTQMEDSLIGKEQVLVDSSSKVVDLGFTVRKFKNLDVVADYDCPDDVGYLLNLNEVELLSAQDQLVAYEQDHKIESGDDLYAADFFGQFRAQAPSFCGKVEYITTGS